MAKPSALTTAVDRRLVALLLARARRRSTVLRLLPPAWLALLVVPGARRLRVKLLTALLALSILVLGAALWLTLR